MQWTNHTAADGLRWDGHVIQSIMRLCEWLPEAGAGARQVIVTSWCFENGALSMDRVRALSQAVGRDRLVLDLSCRRREDGWRVATDRWQTVTDTEVNESLLHELSRYCCEYLIHAADVEGLCQGIDQDLVALLGSASPIPVTYAGGARSLDDLLGQNTIKWQG